MNSRLRLNYGVELECALGGRGAEDLEVGSYHNGVPLVAGFKAERDGTLCSSLRTVELISSMFELREF